MFWFVSKACFYFFPGLKTRIISVIGFPPVNFLPKVQTCLDDVNCQLQCTGKFNTWRNVPNWSPNNFVNWEMLKLHLAVVQIFKDLHIFFHQPQFCIPKERVVRLTIKNKFQPCWTTGIGLINDYIGNYITFSSCLGRKKGLFLNR